MSKQIKLLQAGALALAMLGFAPSASAELAGPSQQVIEVTGNGNLDGTFKVQAGTTRVWVVRLDGDGALSGRAIEGLRLTGAEEDQLTFESAASNSVPVAEEALATVGVHHDKWGTTRLLVKTEIGGKMADDDAGRDPWFSTKTGLNWPIYGTSSGSATNGALGGLSLTANKPLGGPWTGSVELDTNWEGATRGLSSQSGSDWQALRFGGGFGQYRPYGTRWSLGGGLDFGQYGIGAARPLYAKLEASRTALPGQPWETSGQVLGAVGLNSASAGVNANWDFRLSGWWTVGLLADGNTSMDGAQFGVGPALGCNIPMWGNTLRVRTGARLGFKRDTAQKDTGVITPFLQVGLQKGN